MKRFWEKVDKISDPNGCWIWTGYVNPKGYGNFHSPGRSKLVHRIAYELLIGQVPADLCLDHLCRNRRCCNPSHLEPVTPRVNNLRGEGLAAICAAKTHCKNGHEYTPENTYWEKGKKRKCRICKTNNMRAFNDKLKSRGELYSYRKKFGYKSRKSGCQRLSGCPTASG